MAWKRVLDCIGLEFAPVGHKERLLSAVGGFGAILLLFFVTRQWLDSLGTVLVVASAGASTVLLFAAPHAAFSQPWPLLMGHLVAALLGVSCSFWIPDPLLAGACAVGLTILAMHYLRCIHPPGGATALFAVIGSDSVHALGYWYVVTPVMLNMLILLAVAAIFNFLLPWRRYPAALHRRLSPPAKPSGAVPVAIELQDMEKAIADMGSFIDVTEDDLTQIYQLAQQHARDRKAGKP
jgi:CBS-domain-containing membrane protein